MHEEYPWTYITKQPAAKAILYEWKLGLGSWRLFNKFKSRYLIRTDQSATAIRCVKTDCCTWCTREIIGRTAQGSLVAICAHEYDRPVLLSEEESYIYQLNRNLFFQDICAAIDIQYHESSVDDCYMTWRIGDIACSNQKLYPVYFTHQIDETGFLRILKELCYRLSEPFVLITYNGSYRTYQSDCLLSSHQAVQLTLSEMMIFDEEGILIPLRSLSDILSSRLSLNNPPESESALPKNFFRRRGGYWEVRFEGGEVAYLEHQNGMDHLKLLLSRPHRLMSVLEIYSKDTVDTQTMSAMSTGAEDVVDKKYISALRARLDEIDHDISYAEEFQYADVDEKLHIEKEEILDQLRSIVGSGGRHRRTNDPLKKPRDNVAKAIGRAIMSIRSNGLDKLADHLSASLELGNKIAYTPQIEISWETDRLM